MRKLLIPQPLVVVLGPRTACSQGKGVERKRKRERAGKGGRNEISSSRARSQDRRTEQQIASQSLLPWIQFRDPLSLLVLFLSPAHAHTLLVYVSTSFCVRDYGRDCPFDGALVFPVPVCLPSVCPEMETRQQESTEGENERTTRRTHKRHMNRKRRRQKKGKEEKDWHTH